MTVAELQHLFACSRWASDSLLGVCEALAPACHAVCHAVRRAVIDGL